VLLLPLPIINKASLLTSLYFPNTACASTVDCTEIPCAKEAFFWAKEGYANLIVAPTISMFSNWGFIVISV